MASSWLFLIYLPTKKPYNNSVIFGIQNKKQVSTRKFYIFIIYYYYFCYYMVSQ